MKKFFSVLVVIVFICASMLSYNRVFPKAGIPLAKDSLNVVAIQPGTTAFIIQEAILGKVGTGILIDSTGKLMTFYRVYTNGTAGFVTIDLSVSKPIQNFLETCGGEGNACSYSTFKDLLTFMKDSGWRQLQVSELSKYAPLMVEATAGYLLTLAGSALPSLFLFPVTPDFQDILDGKEVEL